MSCEHSRFRGRASVEKGKKQIIRITSNKNSTKYINNTSHFTRCAQQRKPFWKQRKKCTAQRNKFNCKIVGCIRHLDWLDVCLFVSVVVVVLVIWNCYVSIRRSKEVVDMRKAVDCLILFSSVCLLVCWPFNTNRLLIADIANAECSVHHTKHSSNMYAMLTKKIPLSKP